MTAPVVPLHRCIDCDNEISSRESFYSNHHYRLPLCQPCQHEFRTRYKRATKHAIRLYTALRLKNIYAILEMDDGEKQVDIAIKSAKLHIEVDGVQHYWATQALSDLQRTCYSLKNGTMTIHIPNALVRKHLDQTVTYIVDIVNERTIQLKAS